MAEVGRESRLERRIYAIKTLEVRDMATKEELVHELQDLEDEYRFWLVEAIVIARGLDDMEEQINQHEDELGPARVAEFRVRLARTRERHLSIEEKIRYVRLRLEELHKRLKEMS